MRYIVQTYGDIVCPADWRVEGVFDFARFYYVKGGKTTYTGAGGTYGLNRGSLYVFPCHAYYKITHNPLQPFDVTWFHVGLFTSRIAKPAEIPIAAGSLPALLLQSLERAMDRPASVVERLFGVLTDELGPTLNETAVTDGEITALLNRVGANPNEPYTNKQLARMLGYSEKHFIRLFKRHVGVQPHHWVRSMRMGTAVKHLIGGMSVKETAALLGYCSTCNFSRDFKLQYGQSPSQYAAAYSLRP